jgi:hypothetical protein
MCAPRPSATGPGHSHARCGAWPAPARCDASGDRAEWRLCRSRDPRAHSPVAAAGVPVRRAAGNPIHQRQGFLRVVPVRAGQANCEWHATPVADQMTLAPMFGPIGEIRAGLVTAAHGADRTTIHDRPRPISLVGASEPIQQRKVDQIPHARPLPIAQAAPARHPRSAFEFLREHLPGNSAAKHEDNAGQARAIQNARAPTSWP